MRNYVNAISTFNSAFNRNTMSLTRLVKDNMVLDPILKPSFATQGFGIGMNYDAINEDGIDFSGEQIGINITSTLSVDAPQSVYLFVTSTQTISYARGQINVLK